MKQDARDFCVEAVKITLKRFHEGNISKETLDGFLALISLLNEGSDTEIDALEKRLGSLEKRVEMSQLGKARS